MTYTMLAPVGDNIESLRTGVNAFPVSNMVLLKESQNDQTDAMTSVLAEASIPTRTHVLNNASWEALFDAVATLKEQEENDLLMHVATGDALQSCMAMSAAFVNGITAIGVHNGEAITLPLMKFSYENELSERKRELLELIYHDDCCSSLEELSERSGLSKPLISYHVNGNLKSEGMVDMGLVVTEEHGGKRAISLTTLGRLLVQRTVPEKDA